MTESMSPNTKLYVALKALEAVQREQDAEEHCLFCRPETEVPENLLAGHIQDCPALLVAQAIRLLQGRKRARREAKP